jgi:hypothetical protein
MDHTFICLLKEYNNFLHIDYIISYFQSINMSNSLVSNYGILDLSNNMKLSTIYTHYYFNQEFCISNSFEHNWINKSISLIGLLSHNSLRYQEMIVLFNCLLSKNSYNNLKIEFMPMTYFLNIKISKQSKINLKI